MVLMKFLIVIKLNSLKHECGIYIHIKMKSYCLKCNKDTENINPIVSKTINNRTMIISNGATCKSKKSRFIKNQEAKGTIK